MTVELSLTAAAALVTAPAAGLGFLTARMLGRSGRANLTIETLSRSKADIVVIAIYDVVGALVAVAGLVLLGVSKPSPLVSYFNSDPLIAWATFGVVGPVCAVGVLDRLPIIRFVNLSPAGVGQLEYDSNSLRATLADGVALRRKSVERILKCHYEDVLVVEDTERITLLHRAVGLIGGGVLGFDEIALQIEKYIQEFRDGTMPQELEKLLRERESLPAVEDMFLNAERLVGVALDKGLNRPVNIACRVAEAAPVPEASKG